MIHIISELEYSVLKLRKEGLIYSDIAKRIGYSKATACNKAKSVYRLKDEQYLIIISKNQVSKKERKKMSVRAIERSKKKKLGLLPDVQVKFCKNCGKPIKNTGGGRKFCSNYCKSEYHRGPESVNWAGGKTFQPYCYLFNDSLKERVREFFGRKCFVCGVQESTLKKRLCVHHVNYQKSACCDDNIERLFVPLCEKCHNKTNYIRRRRSWHTMIRKELMKRTGGKCYYTKEEMLELRNGTLNKDLQAMQSRMGTQGGVRSTDLPKMQIPILEQGEG